MFALAFISFCPLCFSLHLLVLLCLSVPPFEMKLESFELDAMKGLTLDVQLVNDVFAHIDPKHKRDLRDEVSHMQIAQEPRGIVGLTVFLVDVALGF